MPRAARIAAVCGVNGTGFGSVLPRIGLVAATRPASGSPVGVARCRNRGHVALFLTTTTVMVKAIIA